MSSSISIKGQRARGVGGSPHRDRPQRWGASVTGDCQCAWRACSMWCWTLESCTDRSLPEQLLELSTIPDLGSRLQPNCVGTSTGCHPQVPP